MCLSPGMWAALAILGIILLMNIWHTVLARRFLDQTPALRTSEDLVGFRRIVGQNMYLAVASLALAGVAAIIIVVSLYQGWTQWSESLALFVPSGALLLASFLWVTPAEKRLRELPAADEALEEERDHVVYVWKAKMFPDW